MLRLKIRCPKCGKLSFYFLGSGLENFSIGDYIDTSKDKTYTKEHREKCPYCYEEFDVLEIVKDSRILNVLINPTKAEKEKLLYNLLPELEEYPTIKYSARASLFLGEDSEFIPSQMSTNTDIKIGDEVDFFNKTLIVTRKYKLVYEDAFGNCFTYAYIYELKCDMLKRLLIIRDGYLPVIKEVEWLTSDYTDSIDRLRRYQIPEGLEIIMCN